MSRLSKTYHKVQPFVAPLLDPKNTLNTGKDLLHRALGLGSNPGVPNPFGVPDLSFLGPTASKDDPLFQELLGKINAPSSVDQVQSQVDSKQMQDLLGSIDTNTANQVGSLKSDFQDRGLGGPGQISDIEAAGIGNLRAGAVKAKSQAQLGFENSELERLKAKENAATGAYASRYSSQDARSQLLAKLMSDLYTGGAKNNIDTQQPGYIDNILRNIQLKVG